MTSLEFLRSIDFLQEADDELLGRVASEVERIELEVGEEIFPDGSPGDAMYFIVEGKVRIEKHGNKLITRTPGEYVGEVALIDDDPRTAAAIAETDAVLLRWRKQDFLDSLEESGKVAFFVSRAINAKLRENIDKVSRHLQDLERAAEVQNALLPADRFRNDAIELAAYCRQLDKVGGDYYDYLIHHDRIALIVTDVQGHGFSAGLLVAVVKARVHDPALAGRDPSEVMAALNRAFLDYLNTYYLATACMVVLDPSGELHFCSAGHIPQYHYRAAIGELELMRSTDPSLGLPFSQDAEFHTETRRWSSGDLVLLCSDGVTEAKNEHEDEFGHDRLRDFLRQHRGLEVAELQRRLRRELAEHRGDAALDDDVTVLVARMR